jgi:peptide/nickel transport system ATP-binding protein
MMPVPPAAAPLLDVRDLRVKLPSAAGPGGFVEALRGLSFALPTGGTLGLIGESGCGKSLTALALMGLLPEGAGVSGSIRFEGREGVGLPERDWCAIRGARVAMVFQEPMTALNPLHTIGRQVAEPLVVHRGFSRAAARQEALRLLDRVQLPQAERRLAMHPHELSGGQRQRVVIAMALACRPALLVADEPTTALDVTVQREVLALVQRLVREDGMALVLISHDLALVASQVERLVVMYAGQAVEAGATREVVERLAHPYTRGLFGARPRLSVRGEAGARPRLAAIPGRVPALHEVPASCAFAPRCPRAAPDCTAAPVALRGAAGHAVRCLHPHALPLAAAPAAA